MKVPAMKRHEALLAVDGGEDRVHYLDEGLPGVDRDRTRRAQAVLQYRQLAAQVLAGVPDAAPVVFPARRIQPGQHGGLVDLQQEHRREAIGQL